MQYFTCTTGLSVPLKWFIHLTWYRINGFMFLYHQKIKSWAIPSMTGDIRTDAVTPLITMFNNFFHRVLLRHWLSHQYQQCKAQIRSRTLDWIFHLCHQPSRNVYSSLYWCLKYLRRIRQFFYYNRFSQIPDHECTTTLSILDIIHPHEFVFFDC